MADSYTYYDVTVRLVYKGEEHPLSQFAAEHFVNIAIDHLGTEHGCQEVKEGMFELTDTADFRGSMFSLQMDDASQIAEYPADRPLVGTDAGEGRRVIMALLRLIHPLRYGCMVEEDDFWAVYSYSKGDAMDMQRETVSEVLECNIDSILALPARVLSRLQHLLPVKTEG